MNVQPNASHCPKGAEAWNLPKGDQKVVIAVIGSQEDVFIQQSALDNPGHRPVRQQDLMKVRIFGLDGN